MAAPPDYTVEQEINHAIRTRRYFLHWVVKTLLHLPGITAFATQLGEMGG